MVSVVGVLLLRDLYRYVVVVAFFVRKVLSSLAFLSEMTGTEMMCWP